MEILPILPQAWKLNAPEQYKIPKHYKQSQQLSASEYTQLDRKMKKEKLVQEYIPLETHWWHPSKTL